MTAATITAAASMKRIIVVVLTMTLNRGRKKYERKD
jgi:hypothetical protein